MDFFDSLHCREKRHCLTCRDKGIRGRKFRAGLAVAFNGLSSSFDCPEKKPWRRAALGTPSVGVPSALFAVVESLPPTTPEHRLVKAFARQLSDLLATPRHGSCADRRAFAERIHVKLSWYIDQYCPDLKPKTRNPEPSTRLPHNLHNAAQGNHILGNVLS